MLEPVAAHAIAPVWPWVRDGLQRIIAKTGDDWLPEDVYHEIKGGASRLFLIYADAERIGFLIVQFWPAYHSGPRLFVRALWAEPGKLQPYRDAFYEELKTMARKDGFVALRMNSPRRWDLDGWIAKQVIYEMEV